MSYKKELTENSMNDFFKGSSEFLNLIPNLKEASSKESFINWFEKILLVDKRALYIYLCKNFSSFNREYLEYAQTRIGKSIIPES